MRNLIITLLLIPCMATAQQCDSLATALKHSQQQHITDSLRIKDLDYRLLRIKNYIKIVNKYPKNTKYLKGWINRALQ